MKSRKDGKSFLSFESKKIKEYWKNYYKHSTNDNNEVKGTKWNWNKR